jgi:hypothetical protein
MVTQDEAPPVVDADQEAAAWRLEPLADDGHDRKPALAEMEDIRVVFAAAPASAHYTNLHGSLL